MQLPETIRLRAPSKDAPEWREKMLLGEPQEIGFRPEGFPIQYVETEIESVTAIPDSEMVEVTLRVLRKIDPPETP